MMGIPELSEREACNETDDEDDRYDDDPPLAHDF
jgi:hypothetical protein